MSSPRQDAAATLTLEDARAIIAAQLAEVDSRSLEVLGAGWEFHVFRTADGWVFRFPRHPEAARLFESEWRVHDLVSRALPAHVGVPRVQLMGRPGLEFPYPFAGHRLIAGVAADRVQPVLLPTLAHEIGAALGAIHAVGEGHARAAGVAELDPAEEGRIAWFERAMAVLPELAGLDPAVDRAVEWVKRLPSPFHRYDGPLRLIHHDLSPEHLIVDATTGRLKGILDWTDAILGDPARDFVFLVTWRGWRLAEDVLSSYPLPVDHAFRDRLGFMARLLSVMWLAGAHAKGSELAGHVASVRNAFASPEQPTS